MERAPEVEIRPYTILYEHKEHGRSRMTIECPYCGQRLVVYNWSFAGSGKKCVCGAIISMYSGGVRRR